MAQTTANTRINIRRKPAPEVVATDAVKPARRSVSTRVRSTVSLTAKSVFTHAAGAAIKFFVFVEGARPVSGQRLKAHTDAALRFLGLASMEPARKNAVVAVMGNRAVKHHLEMGNLEEAAQNVKLTPQGYAVFRQRAEGGKFDGKLAAAFLAAISKGTTNAEAGIRDSHVIPVGIVIRG